MGLTCPISNCHALKRKVHCFGIRVKIRKEVNVRRAKKELKLMRLATNCMKLKSRRSSNKSCSSLEKSHPLKRRWRVLILMKPSCRGLHQSMILKLPNRTIQKRTSTRAKHKARVLLYRIQWASLKKILLTLKSKKTTMSLPSKLAHFSGQAVSWIVS